MLSLAEHLGHAVSDAIAALAPGLPVEGALVGPTADPAHGDYQSNIAFKLARPLGLDPQRAARQLADALAGHPAVRAAEVAGKGFLNLRLREDWMARTLAEGLTADGLGLPQDGCGRRVVIDYGSPNVAKRMHVGHLRSTNIGDALARMMRALGWEVIGDNHLGDWGTQFGKLIVAWERWRDDAAFEADPIEELHRIYVRFTAEVERDPALEDRAREATAMLQAGEPAQRALWQAFVQASLVEFEGVYRRMGVRFDVSLGESFYEPMLAPLIEDLHRAGLCVEDEGALVLRFDERDGKGLAEAPMLVRKRDGAALYATTDLAALRYRQ